MKIITVTYLTFLILFQGVFIKTDILFEINELVEDYQLHKAKYGDNLTTFFSKHFGDLKEAHKEQHQQDHKKHKHPANDFNNNIQVDYAFYNLKTALQKNIEIINNQSNSFYLNGFSTFEKPTIFQPPRLA